MDWMSGRYTLFKGATRLPTLGGVPRTVMGVTLLACATLWLLIHFWAVVLFAVVYFIEWIISKNDDRIFRVVFLAFRTKVLERIRSPFTKVWGAASCSPVDYKGE